MLLVTVALILRQNELLVLLVVMIKVYVDFYIGYAFGAQILTLVLLGVFFLMRSSSFPWVNPPSLWLWFLLLASSILPSLRGVSTSDSAYYYFNVIFFPLIIFWLGMVSARNPTSIYRLFQLLAAFATLIAVITIIQSLDGVLLFKSTRYDSALALLSNYQLGTSGIARPGAYFINPDSDGGFLGVMLLIPFGLLAVSRSLLGKVIYCFRNSTSRICFVVYLCDFSMDRCCRWYYNIARICWTQALPYPILWLYFYGCISTPCILPHTGRPSSTTCPTSK